MIDWKESGHGLVFCDIGLRGLSSLERADSKLGCNIYLRNDEVSSVTLKKFVSAHSPLYSLLEQGDGIDTAFDLNDLLLLRELTKALQGRRHLRFWEGFTDRVCVRTLLNDGLLVCAKETLCDEEVQVFRVDYGYDTPLPLFISTLLRVVDVNTEEILYVREGFKMPLFRHAADGFVPNRPCSLFVLREDSLLRHSVWQRIATFTDEKDADTFIEYQLGRIHHLPCRLVDCMTFHGDDSMTFHDEEEDE